MTKIVERLIAKHRHERLGVTYGLKKWRVMAVDEMLAAEIAALNLTRDGGK